MSTRINGEVFRALLETKGLLHRDVAKATDLTTATISLVISGAEGLGEKRAKRLEAGLVDLGFTPSELRKLGLQRREKGTPHTTA